MESYDPSAIVLQCGTDSLSGDKLGCLNLSMRGNIDSKRFMKVSFTLMQAMQIASSLSSPSTSRFYSSEAGDILCEMSAVPGLLRLGWRQVLSWDLVRYLVDLLLPC